MVSKDTWNKGDLKVDWEGDYVFSCRICRPPNNYFDIELIQDIASVYAQLDDDSDCRAIVLASEGAHFCAGNNFGGTPGGLQGTNETGNPLYHAAVKIFSGKKVVVAAVQGAAVGGGFGLALSADFRVGCEKTRMTGNFVKLGFTPGFGITHTLPRLVGVQTATDILLSGRRIKGDEALQIGLLDKFADNDAVFKDAVALAKTYAENAPLAVQRLREVLRGDLAQKVKETTDIEAIDQFRLQQTQDHKEGVRAVMEKRTGNFIGR